MEEVMKFDNYDDFAKHIEQVRKNAEESNDLDVLSRAAVDDNTYWVNMTYAGTDLSMVIFCKVIGKTEFLAQQAEDDDAPLHYYLERWEDQQKTGFLFSRCYSSVEPRGEYGDTHTTRLTWQLEDDEWAMARECEWRVLDSNGQLTPIGIILATKELEYAVKQEQEAK